MAFSLSAIGFDLIAFFCRRLRRFSSYIVHFVAVTALCCFSIIASALDATPLSTCESESNAFLYDAECGEVATYLDSIQAEGQTLQLNLVRIPALTDGDKKAIFFLAGGPGQAATQLVPMIRQQFSELLRHYDFVFFDQRGTGESNGLMCSEINLPSSEDYASQQQVFSAKMRACLDSFQQQQLDFYITRYAVEDIEAVRKQLGYTQISLWGASYGTRVAMAYMQAYPQNVSAAVLDGVAPYQLQLPRFALADSERALAKLLKRCALDNACNHAYPRLSERWKTLLDDLQQAPKKVSLAHPRTQAIEEVFIDHRVLSGWLRSALYVRDVSPLLPLAMDAAIKHNFERLYFFANLGESISGDIADALQFSVLCAEDRTLAARIDSASLKALPQSESNTQTLLALQTDEVDQVCNAVPESRLSQTEIDFKPNSVPTLLLSGDYDPVTPPHWAEYAQKWQLNAEHIVISGGHHGVSFLGCVPDLIYDFYKTKRVNKLIRACVDKIQPKAFFTSNAGPSMHTEAQINVPDDLNKHTKILPKGER